MVNVSVCTDAHRDGKDAEDLCFLFFLGKWLGGAIVLVEPGLVFNVQPLDFLAFPSARVTHLNLHFDGRRFSIVYHSDRQGQAWVTDRNGWQPHIFTY